MARKTEAKNPANIGAIGVQMVWRAVLGHGKVRMLNLCFGPLIAGVCQYHFASISSEASG
jgi:hypothetical protein